MNWFEDYRLQGKKTKYFLTCITARWILHIAGAFQIRAMKSRIVSKIS